MSSRRIKKGDTVMVIRGAERGKTGKVMQVFPASGRAVVEGLKLVKKTFRKSQEHPQGGIAEIESPMDLSNLLLYCPTCKKGVRIRVEEQDGRRVRKCKKCGHAFEG